jgi:hypothetical protein
MYREAVLQLVNALKHEQFRCGYLSSEVQAMLAVRERWLWKISNCKEGEKPPGTYMVHHHTECCTKYAHGSIVCCVVLRAYHSQDHQQLTDDILNTSALAHELREIYHSLSDHGQARLCLNRWVDLHLSLDDSLKHPKFPIRPYHTLLLLGTAWQSLFIRTYTAALNCLRCMHYNHRARTTGSRSAILDSLPQDASPTLKLFINALHSALQPSKSFQVTAALLRSRRV